MTQTITSTCSMAGCGKNFKIVTQELTFYERKKLPLPQHCPSCRHKIRMALRSERALYRRICCYCNNPCLSTFSETAPYKVACQNCYWEHSG